MKFRREWAMPSGDTLSIPCIAGFAIEYVKRAKVIVDPFARNSKLGTITNDLSPETSAQYHMEATEFLKLIASKGIKADLVIFDPPYSPRQISECYQSIGLSVSSKNTQSSFYTDAKNAILAICGEETVVLSFGWNSVGMGKKNGFKLEEILLVCHGGAHNDTICIAERRVVDEPLFSMMR